MRLVIDVPAQYATAVRAELRRRGNCHNHAEVRRVLRYVISETMDRHWWRPYGVRMYWQPETPTETTNAAD